MMANTRRLRDAQGKVGHAELLDAVEGHIEEIRHELTIHMKRLGHLQEQVEEVRLAVRELMATAAQP